MIKEDKTSNKNENGNDFIADVSISLRDKIAINAMSAMIGNFEANIHQDIREGFGAILAKSAYKMADEMILAREQ